MKETDFEEWLEWANSTNELGIANIEPVISNILVFSDEFKNLFMGKSWNGSNWANISKSYRNMLMFLLIKNPLKYTYLATLGRSILNKEYPGIYEVFLYEALEKVPNEHWGEFISRYLPNKKVDSSFSTVDSIEKLQLVRDALTIIINRNTGSDELAKTFEDFYETNYPIKSPSGFRSELEKPTKE